MPLSLLPESPKLEQAGRSGSLRIDWVFLLTSRGHPTASAPVLFRDLGLWTALVLCLPALDGGGVASPPHPQRFLSRVCFARVTCLIISFSGGRLFLVSTVTAPLRGEAIRQRVKQVIKTLKPMCTERGRDGGRGLSEVRRPREQPR